MNPNGDVYDDKHNRIINRPASGGWCEECKCYGGHKTICKHCTPEWMAYLASKAQERETWARQRAAGYLVALQKMHGKLAMLRHENNVLRKANARLRAGKEPEQKDGA